MGLKTGLATEGWQLATGPVAESRFHANWKEYGQRRSGLAGFGYLPRCGGRVPLLSCSGELLPRKGGLGHGRRFSPPWWSRTASGSTSRVVFDARGVAPVGALY